jgi:hypothetical protein
MIEDLNGRGYRADQVSILDRHVSFSKSALSVVDQCRVVVHHD